MASDPYWAEAPSLQDLHLAHCDGRQGGDVGSLRTVGDTVAAEEDNHRGPVPSLAVDEDQRVVRRQVAYARRPGDAGRVADRLRGHVVRWHHVAQKGAQVGISLPRQVRDRDDVDRHHRFGGRARVSARPDDHEPFNADGGREQDDVEPGGLVVRHVHLVGRRSVAETGEAHAVGASREISQAVRPGGTGECAHLSREGDLDALDRLSGSVGDRALDDPLPRRSQWGHQQAGEDDGEVPGCPSHGFPHFQSFSVKGTSISATATPSHDGPRIPSVPLVRVYAPGHRGSHRR